MERKKFGLSTIILIVLGIVLLFSIWGYIDTQNRLDSYIKKSIQETEILLAKEYKEIHFNWGIGLNQESGINYFGMAANGLCQVELEDSVGDVDWKNSNCRVDNIKRVGDFECSEYDATDCFIALDVKCDCDYLLE